MMKNFSILSFLLLFSLLSFAQKSSFWTDVSEIEVTQLKIGNQKKYLPEKYRTLQFDYAQLKEALKNASEDVVKLPLPMPDGSQMVFNLKNTPVMQSGLAAKYPSIQNFSGVSENRKYKVNCGYGPKGFHAVLRGIGGTVYIDNLTKGNSEFHLSYFSKDFSRPNQGSLECGYSPEKQEESTTPHEIEIPENTSNTIANRTAGEQVELRTYRLAMAATAEYSAYHGGDTAALAAIVIKVARLNSVYEKDFAVRLILIDKNDEIIFTNPAIDPYTNGNTGEMIQENTNALQARIGFANFDIGHVLGTNFSLSGLASLGGICNPRKASAASTIPNPEGDDFVIDIIAHEMGHQFSANHTMNSCHNVNLSTAYELGGGVTIMSYSGICGAANNIAQHSYDYYHAVSMQEITRFINTGGNSCPVKTLINNTFPDVNIPLDTGFYIPISTPFRLTVNAVDAEDQDNLTYNWEQFDLGPMSTPGQPSGNAPLFRNFAPSTSPTRVFPMMSRVVNQVFTHREEYLPDYRRDLTFRCVVRDNNPEGGAAMWDEISFHVDSVRPFKVIFPNESNLSIEAGSETEIQWDVAETFDGPVQCKLVNIKLSLDGGFTFPITILENAVNDGSEKVFLPNMVSSQARIMVEAADNIFFQISKSNFEISPATTPGYSLSISPQYQKICLPGSTQMEILTESFLNFTEKVNLELVNVPSAINYSFSKNKVAPGESSVLAFDIENSAGNGLIEFSLLAFTDGGDTIQRDIVLELFRNDFSDMETVAPIQGVAGILESPEFIWKKGLDAELYDFQLATNPAFAPGDLVEEATNLIDTSYIPTDLLEENLPYYWRVRPTNRTCGNGDFIQISAFHTVSKKCQSLIGLEGDVQRIPIPGSGLPTIQSSVSILDPGTINDVNIPNIRGSYEPLKSIRISLISPDSTRAILFEKRCNGSVFNFGFDDAIADRNPCPAANGRIRGPQDKLSIFNGRELTGSWTLEIDVQSPGVGGGGSLEEWELEFCADLTLEAPTLLVNDTLPVQFGLGEKIARNYLETIDDFDDEWNINYTIVSLPKFGGLVKDGESVKVGEQFTQRIINEGRIWYVHDGISTEEFDNFTFTIRDSEGGWLATPQFNFKLDLGTVGVDDINPELQDQITIFPNPANSVLNIQIDRILKEEVNIQLFNAQGKLMKNQIINNPDAIIKMDISDMTGGFYFLSFTTEKGRATKSLVVEK